MRPRAVRSSLLARVALPAALLAGLVLVAGAGTASAQSATERYDVTFEGVTSNCAKDRELALSKGRIAIERGTKQVKLRFEGLTGAATLPELVGSQRRDGEKIKAKATGTDAQGRRQRLTVSGRVDESGIQLLFIAELSDASGGSQCSQSWNVTGKRAR